MSRHTRSHPPTLLTLAKRTLERECGPLRHVTVVAAVSGGRDSMALLHVLSKLARTLGFVLRAHGIDHGLRHDAASELDVAEAFALELGVPFARTKVTLRARDGGRAATGNVQERAREARYAALEDVLAGIEPRRVSDTAWTAQPAALVATAHHADDRAETVLLRLMRGASAAGLGVLAPRTGTRIRPFVRARRAAIDLHVARHGVPYVDDPSNLDPRFLRTRVRREVIPTLEALSPGIVEHLCGVADDLVRQPLASGDALPRPTRNALEALGREKNPRARVALPGGRVARWDATLAQVVVEVGDVRPRRMR